MTFDRGARLPGRTMIEMEQVRLRALEEEKDKAPPRYCKDCLKQLDILKLNSRTLVFVCDNFKCVSLRRPQGYLTVRKLIAYEQKEIDNQLGENLHEILDRVG